jgi:hypothetical protein
MNTDPRAFHAVRFFSGFSLETIQALTIDGGYQALAAKFSKVTADNERLRVELARVNDKAQRVLERLP